MRKWVESISDMLIPSLVFAAILAILTGGAFFTKMGQRMQTESEDFTNCIDTGKTEEVCAREEPEISYSGKKIWKTGETIPTGTCFRAKDAEGNPLVVEVREITDEKGNDTMDCYQKVGQTAVFSRRGVYTFRVYAIDSERKAAEKKFSLMIDSR